jgi:hypothetical protein
MKRAVVALLLTFGCFAVITSCTKTPGIKPDYSIKLSSETLTLGAGLTAQVASANYTASQLTWTSSDTTVATVDNTGLVTTLKPGNITISIKNTEHNQSATLNLTVTPGKFTDVGVGADGSVFLVGADQLPGTLGYRVYKYVNNELHKLPDCAAIRIAVSPQGVPWVINYQNQVLMYSDGAWQQKPGLATDIGIGADGSIYAVSTTVYSTTGGFTILKWNGTAWDTMTDCSGTRIAVDQHGTPWVTNKSNIVYQYSGSVLWNPINAVQANDIGIGSNGAVYISAWDTGVYGYNPPVYQFNGTSFTQVNNVFGTALSVGPTGAIWWLDISGALHNQ